MIVQITKDGAKNFSVLVKGTASSYFNEKLFDLNQLTPPSQGWKGLRLDSVVWIVQEKMGFQLWWGEEKCEDNLILPVESRNFLRLDEGIPSPRVKDGWKGEIWISSFWRPGEDEFPGPWSYLLILDFDKQ